MGIFIYINSQWKRTLNMHVLLLQNYKPTSLQINTKLYHYTCASSIAMNIIQHATLEMLHDVAVTSTDYKNLCTCCSLTFWQLHKLQLSHIKLFHSTGVGITRCNWQRWWLQVLWSLQHVQKGCLKVKIVCWNVLQTNIFQTAYLGCYAEVDCSMNFNVLTVCTSNVYL